MSAHALLSPSGASRWIACTPSARLESTFPDTTNTAAEEGTLAHSLSELLLKKHLNLISTAPFKSELKKIKAHQLFTKEMEGHSIDYVNFITDILKDHDTYEIYIEERLDLRQYAPESFGTADCVIITDGHLYLNDLKYGKGVEVSAIENKQLMLYALGALSRFGLLYDIDFVVMNIFQPRLDNYSSFTLSVAELLTWGEQVKVKALQAYNGEGELVAGDHCKFCKARVTCKALAEYNLELARHAFADPNTLSDDDIADILAKAADFKTWLTAVQQYALSETIKNKKKWPGFKLVAGRSVRVLSDKKAILEKLAGNFDESLYLTEPTLLGIGALEKNIGKAKLNTLIGDYVIKPPGAATLVPDSDKRPELNSHEACIDAFEGIELDENG